MKSWFEDRAVAAVAVGSLVLVACGGGLASGAALQVSVLPGDRDVTRGRLEALANRFESEFPGCTPDDTIVIAGVSPGVYTAAGCGHDVAYQIACGAHGVGGYSVRTCDWRAISDDLYARAAADLHCDVDTIDVEPSAEQFGRLMLGCGFRATYALQCNGQACQWGLVGPVTQASVDGTATVGADGAPVNTVSTEPTNYVH